MFSFLKRKSKFAAKPAKTSKAAKSAPKASGPSVWSRPQVRVGALLFGLALAGAGLGFGAVYGVGALEGWQSRQPGCRLPTGPEAIDMDAPAWIPPGEVRAIKVAMAGSLSADPYDTDGLTLAANQLRGHRAVGEVYSIRRGADGRLKAVVGWFVPAALVTPTVDTPSLVDAQGRVLLSDMPAQLAAGAQLPVIQGVASKAPFGKGEWKDPALLAALDLLTLIQRDTQVRGIRGMRLAATPAGPEITLQLTSAAGRNLEVLWGLPIGASADAPSGQRLGALVALLRDPRTQQAPAGSHFAVRTGTPTQQALAPAAPATAAR